MPTSDLLDRLSHSLSRRARVQATLFGRRVSTFQLFGLLGFAASVALGLSLSALRGLSLVVMTGVIAVALITFFVVALATKAVTGAERLVYYHHELAIAASTSAYVALLEQPVLAFLDVTLVALAGLLALGRLGCFCVGCCHGRAHDFGVTYGTAHVQAGLAGRWLGVRLFPIQLFESLLALTALVVGVLLLALGAAAGTASIWQIACYAWGRFLLEFGRGDEERPYHLGLSQAQWISLVLLVGAMFREVVSGRPWLLAPCAALTLLASVTLIVRLRTGRRGRSRNVALQPGYRLEQLTILPKPRRARP